MSKFKTYYSLVLYTDEYNIDNLIKLKDRLLGDALPVLFSSNLFEINNKVIDNEEVYYFKYIGCTKDKVSKRYIIREMNELTLKYNVKWALQIIYYNKYNFLDGFYQFDETDSFLDNNKVHIFSDNKYFDLNFYTNNISELKEKLTEYIPDKAIEDIAKSIDFSSRNGGYLLFEDDDEDIFIEYNTFEKVDNKYFYWNK